MAPFIHHAVMITAVARRHPGRSRGRRRWKQKITSGTDYGASWRPYTPRVWRRRDARPLRMGIWGAGKRQQPPFARPVSLCTAQYDMHVMARLRHRWRADCACIRP